MTTPESFPAACAAGTPGAGPERVTGARTRAVLRPGCVYLERGSRVEILARWGAGGGPRNVLIRREDGSRVVRPFRGLRRP